MGSAPYSLAAPQALSAASHCHGGFWLPPASLPSCLYLAGVGPCLATCPPDGHCYRCLWVKARSRAGLGDPCTGEGHPRVWCLPCPAVLCATAVRAARVLQGGLGDPQHGQACYRGQSCHPHLLRRPRDGMGVAQPSPTAVAPGPGILAQLPERRGGRKNCCLAGSLCWAAGCGGVWLPSPVQPPQSEPCH